MKNIDSPDLWVKFNKLKSYTNILSVVPGWYVETTNMYTIIKKNELLHSQQTDSLHTFFLYSSIRITVNDHLL